MRLGLFGGTFDPVHVGHLVLAEQCREQCGLDEVWFIPAGSPPHKRHAPLTPARARTAMLEFAIAGHPGFRVSRIELEREGPTYTVDTLERLDGENPERELFFLMGADSLADLAGWREPQRIAELATIVAVNRGDRPLPDRAALVHLLGERIADRVVFVTMPGIDLSASDLRRRAREGHSLRFLVPRPVEIYIHEHGLYRA
ncbi:MAG TPA: nicotinate-nucleotide adenylyltransferase [Planctomycetaceae bacterium]|nr:nicotinate-nucleotide adenylyltransferase [Planctomycetaceae bacterium]